MLEAVILRYGGNKGRFAERLGITAPVLSSWLAKEKFDAEKIYKCCPDISADWLLSGEGKMIAKRGKDITRQGIPLLTVEAMAGPFSGDFSVNTAECERYIIPEITADFLIRIKGDSMDPTYKSGDLATCRFVKSQRIEWNKVYVIDTTDGPLIKRVRKGSDEDHILIISDNDIYDPFEITTSEVRNLAIVTGYVRGI